MPEINVAHVLERAGRTDVGAGRPRQADLRRGISDAYYALFHGLTAAVSLQTLSNVPPAAVQSFRRKLSHSALRDYCERVASGTKLPAPHALSNAAAADVHARVVAQSFVDLQEERYSADYAHDEAFGLVRLNAGIALAQRSLDALRDHRNEPGMASFLSLLATTSGWAQTAS